MIVINRFLLRLAFVSSVVIVATITVTFTLQGLCERVYYQPMSQMHKRILKAEDSTFGCDVMFVERGRSTSLAHGHRKTITYNCLNVEFEDSNALQAMSDYQCMFYAMITNPNCKGYLFLAGKDKLHNMENVMQNDRKRIWYGKRINSGPLQADFQNENEHLFNLKEITICKKAFQELALFILGVNSYEKHFNGSWNKPWNAQMALNALLWNGKGKLVCFYENVEKFYIPVKYRERFLGLASVFSKVGMSDGIAVPTILKSLDLESTFVKISI